MARSCQTIAMTYAAHRLPSQEPTPPLSGPYYSTIEGTLILSKATKSDSGNYTCIGRNIFGSASESTSIIIIETMPGIHIWSMTEGAYYIMHTWIRVDFQCSCIHTYIYMCSSNVVHCLYHCTAMIPVWMRWWMWFVYALGVWLLCTMCLVVLYGYRRCTTKRTSPIPVNIDGKALHSHSHAESSVDI